MEDWRIITIIIGIIGALAGVYFRESLRKALRQKIVASKLEAQLTDIIRDITSNEFVNLFVLGELWRKDREKALLEKGAGGFIDIEKKYEEILKELKKKIDNGDESVDEPLRKTYKVYKEMPESLFRYQIQQLEIVRDCLFKNIGFISEDEAAEISWDTVSRVVSVRSYFINLIHQYLSLLLVLREMDKPELDAIRPFVYRIAEQGIRLSLHLEPLRTKAKLIRTKSITALTIANIIGKP
jgi:gas vesicle protein